MILNIISTGSKGNCYAIEEGSEVLLLDCGVSIKELKVGIDFKMGSIIGCLLTHEHGDHSKCVNELIRYGIEVYASEGTSNALDIIPSKTECSHGSEFLVGRFLIKAFEIPHDAAEPLGFLIYDQETGIKIAYITDAMYCGFRFPGLTHVILEANYSKELLSKSGYNTELQNRVMKTHMSVETALNFCEINKENLRQIILVHLSDRNSNEKEFKILFQEKLGKEITIPNKGDKIIIL